VGRTRRRGWDAELVAELDVRDEDHIVEKHTYDAFYQTDLEGYLDTHGIDDLLICGTLANVCVLHTAGSAGLRDYRPVVVEDALGYITEDHREYAVESTPTGCSARRRLTSRSGSNRPEDGTIDPVISRVNRRVTLLPPMGTVAYGTLSTRHARRGRGRARSRGVGFAGAASVTDGEAIDGGTGPDEGAIGGDAIGGDEPGNDEDGQTGSVPVDPDAPFEARLLRDGDDDRRLFGTGDLDRVQGVITEDDEHLVYVSLGDAGIDALQTGLTDAGATDDPEGVHGVDDARRDRGQAGRSGRGDRVGADRRGVGRGVDAPVRRGVGRGVGVRLAGRRLTGAPPSSRRAVMSTQSVRGDMSDAEGCGRRRGGMDDAEGGMDDAEGVWTTPTGGVWTTPRGCGRRRRRGGDRLRRAALPLCETPMYHRHCKYVCPAHGVVYDCSDTFY